jgi:hypothetical protein
MLIEVLIHGDSLQEINLLPMRLKYVLEAVTLEAPDDSTSY